MVLNSLFGMGRCVAPGRTNMLVVYLDPGEGLPNHHLLGSDNTRPLRLQPFNPVFII